MSLFKSRDWWEINLNEVDSYDSQSLLILTLNSDKFESILLGSHNGYLRLFSPSSKTVDDGTIDSTYEPSHLMLELHLGAPILQIKEGVLISGSQEKQLAVLHPHLFSVYSLKKKKAEETKVGDQMVIELAYQHVLRHSAHSFVLGFFGSVRGRHFISILSLDGLLSFYEQESFAFQLYLSDFLFPFTFTYLDKTDSFLFLNGHLNFDCYSYESIASAGPEKKPVKSWEYDIGEAVMDVQTVTTGNELVIVVLSERGLYGLSENGKLIMSKRLEYPPVSFCTYLTDENKKLIIVIATQEQYINVYEGTNLRWSMKISQVPVCLRRIFLNRLPGGLALLSEDGFLQCIYVGTHPSVYLVSPLAEEEIDVTKAEHEMRDLQKKIKNNDVMSPVADALISMQIKVDRNIKNHENKKTCDIIIDLDAQSFVRSLQVLIQVEPPLASAYGSKHLTNFSGRTFLENSIHLSESGIPSSLSVQIVVTYITSEGVTGCCSKTEVLPLSLVFEESPPQKEAQYKLTIHTNKTTVAVNKLFREFGGTIACAAHAIGLKLSNSNDVVTILEAKSSQKYRIQSDTLAALTLPLFALIERLKLQFQKHSDFEITNSSPLPLESFFEGIRMHHELVNTKTKLEDKLRQEASQYGAIQKKILANLKNAAPKPSSNIHKLLMDTSKMISFSLSALESTEENLRLSKCSLASFNRLLGGLLELNAPSQKGKDLTLIRRLFDPFVLDSDEQGCLEVQEAATLFVLRAALNKSRQDQEKATEINKEPLKDTSRLTKHLSMVVDRIIKESSRKGIKETTQQNQKEFHNENDNVDEQFLDDVIPAATRFTNLKEDTFTNGREEKYNAEISNSNTNTSGTSTGSSKGEKKRSTEAGTTDGGQEKTKIEVSSDPSAEEDDDAIWDVKMDEVQL